MSESWHLSSSAIIPINEISLPKLQGRLVCKGMKWFLWITPKNCGGKNAACHTVNLAGVEPLEGMEGNQPQNT